MTNDVRLRFGYIWIRRWQSNDPWLCTYEKLREEVTRRVAAAGGAEAYIQKLEKYEQDRISG